MRVTCCPCPLYDQQTTAEIMSTVEGMKGLAGAEQIIWKVTKRRTRLRSITNCGVNPIV